MLACIKVIALLAIVCVLIYQNVKAVEHLARYGVAKTQRSLAYDELIELELAPGPVAYNLSPEEWDKQIAETEQVLKDRQAAQDALAKSLDEEEQRLKDRQSRLDKMKQHQEWEGELIRQEKEINERERQIMDRKKELGSEDEEEAEEEEEDQDLVSVAPTTLGAEPSTVTMTATAEISHTTDYKIPITELPTPSTPSTPTTSPIATTATNPENNEFDFQEPDTMEPSPGFKSVIYFCNWAIYDRGHFPADIPAERITHVMYAFANINRTTGEVELTDPWSDTDCTPTRSLPATSATNPAGATRTGGCFGEFYKLKRKHRHLKVLLSIGGWTYSENFAKGVDTPQKRQNFAKSAVDLVNLLALDGVDLDWEYAMGKEQADQYVDVCRRVRHELDSLAVEMSVARDQFDLSVAAPGGTEQLSELHIPQMDKYLSFWNLMTYDYSGEWSQVSEYHSNLYNGSLNAHSTVTEYVRAGASPAKLVLGVPIYGRAFANTKGIGHPFNGTGNGTWEVGVYDYKELPLNGSKEHTDSESVSAYCFDKKNKVLVTYDNPESMRAKARYIRDNGLGGVMYWESSADFPVDHPRSIIGAVTNELEYLDMRENRVMKEVMKRDDSRVGLSA